MKAFVLRMFFSVSVVLLSQLPAVYGADAAAKDQNKYPVGTVFGKDGKPVSGQVPSPAQDLIAPKAAPSSPFPRTEPANATVNPQPAVNVPLPREVLPTRGPNGHHVCEHPYHCKATGFGFMAFTCEAPPPYLVWKDCEEVQQFCRDETSRPEPFEPQLYRQHCFA